MKDLAVYGTPTDSSPPKKNRGLQWTRKGVHQGFASPPEVHGWSVDNPLRTRQKVHPKSQAFVKSATDSANRSTAEFASGLGQWAFKRTTIKSAADFASNLRQWISPVDLINFAQLYLGRVARVKSYNQWTSPAS